VDGTKAARPRAFDIGGRVVEDKIRDAGTPMAFTT